MRRVVLHLVLVVGYLLSVTLATWHFHVDDVEPDSVVEHHEHLSTCGMCDALSTTTPSTIPPSVDSLTDDRVIAAACSQLASAPEIRAAKVYRFAPKTSPPARA